MTIGQREVVSRIVTFSILCGVPYFVIAITSLIVNPLDWAIGARAVYSVWIAASFIYCKYSKYW